MAITRISNREFNKNTAKALKATKQGPAFITNRGSVTYVLLTVAAYERITSRNRGEELATTQAAPIEPEQPRFPPR